MARGKAVTKRGRCIQCSGPVAWKTVGEAWVLFNAEIGQDGTPVVKDGRFVASNERHTSCWQGSTATATQQTVIPEATAATATATATVDVDAILGKVRGEVVAVLDTFGIRQQTVLTIEVTGRKAFTTDEATHVTLPRLLRYMAARRAIYIHGPAGGGKTYGAIQAATILGLEAIVVTMPGITAGKLLGFVDAGGREVETPFLRAFVNGGVFVADEFDRMIPSVAAALNSALANRCYTVGNRTVTAHADFVFVATGNTDMRGATRQYTAAQPLDLATAARFAFLPWGYDEASEMVIATGKVQSAKPLVEWMRKLRTALRRDTVDTVWAGPRETYAVLDALLMGETLPEALDAWVWRGYSPDAVARYLREFPLPPVDVKAGGKK